MRSTFQALSLSWQDHSILSRATNCLPCKTSSQPKGSFSQHGGPELTAESRKVPVESGFKELLSLGHVERSLPALREEWVCSPSSPSQSDSHQDDAATCPIMRGPIFLSLASLGSFIMPQKYVCEKE